VGTATYRNWTGMDTGMKFYWKVRAANVYGTGQYSDLDNFTTIKDTPLAPSNVTIDVLGTNSLRVRWTDNSQNEDEYELERSQDGANYAWIKDVGVNVSSHTDTGLAPNRQYWYRVRAYTSGGESDYAVVSAGKYTQANVPYQPVCSGDYDTANNHHVDIALSQIGNPAGTEQAVMVGGQYLQSNGDLSDSEYWTTGLEMTHRNLNASNVYSYTVKAKNAEAVETGFCTAVNVQAPPPLGTAYKIGLAVPQTIRDGRESCVIEAKVQDAEGSTVTGSTAEITFDVTGEGLIDGTTNQALVTAAGGIATVRLVSGLVTGTVSITAAAPGLVTGQSAITVISGSPVRVLLELVSPDQVVNCNRDYVDVSMKILDAYNQLVTGSRTITFKVMTGNELLYEESTGTVSGELVWRYNPDKAGRMLIKGESAGLQAGTVELEVTYFNPFGGEVVFSDNEGKTKATISPGIFVADGVGWGDELSIRVNISTGTFDYEKQPAGAKFIPGTLREFTALKYSAPHKFWQVIEYSTANYISVLENDYPIRITLPYPDDNGDGIIDGGIGLPAEASCVRSYLYNEGTGAWEKMKEWPEVNKSERAASFGVKHFSKYCLMVVDSDIMKINYAYNYPNPFNPQDGTTFVYGLTANADDVTITIYTISGRVVRSINVSGELGENEVIWDGNDDNGDSLANGVYVYKIKAVKGSEEKEITKKIVIMK
jgi:hypothetical protein